MTELGVPQIADLNDIAAALDAWQSDDGPIQLHSGDLGWYSLRGARATARALRVWSAADGIRAVGLLDGEDLLRLAIDPSLRSDESLAQDITANLTSSTDAVFATETAVVEARGAHALSDCLTAAGWMTDEPWTPLSRDLHLPVEQSALRVEIVCADDAEAWTSVHWSAFRGTPYSADDRARFIDRWTTMLSGPFAQRARVLLGYDEASQPVAAAAVWSAGPVRPGLLEPVAVHRDHQGRGFGTAMAHAAAEHLRQMGSSSAFVATESSNTGAVATYRAAGFTPHAEVRDLRRPR